MRMRSAERRPETRRGRPSEHGPSRYFPSAARSCVTCSDASYDENGRRRQEFCSPSVPSRVALARPRVRRAASRAIGQLVAVNRQRSSRPSLLGAPTVSSARLLRRFARKGHLVTVSLSDFRVFRVRELAGRSGSSSETPPLNPPKRPKEVGVAHRHNSRQQGKRYRPATNEGTGNVVGRKANLTSTTSLPAPPPQKTRPRNRDAQRHQYVGAWEGVAPVCRCVRQTAARKGKKEGGAQGRQTRGPATPQEVSRNQPRLRRYRPLRSPS